MDFRLDPGMNSVLDPGIKIIIDHVFSRKIKFKINRCRLFSTINVYTSSFPKEISGKQLSLFLKHVLLCHR